MSSSLSLTLAFFENHTTTNYFSKNANHLNETTSNCHPLISCKTLESLDKIKDQHVLAETIASMTKAPDTEKALLSSARNIKEWVLYRPYCSQKVIEECAFMILKNNHLNRWVDFTGESYEEQLLRHVFKSVDYNSKIEEKEELFEAILPKLESLTPFQATVEKIKSLCNGLGFKLFAVTALYYVRPKLCLLLENKVIPCVKEIVDRESSLSVACRLTTVFFNANIYVRSYPIPIWPFFSVLNNIIVERTPPKSLVHRILSVVSAAFSFKFYGSEFFDDGMTFITKIGAKVITSNFELRTDRDKEAENLFVRLVLDHKGVIPKG